MRGGSTNPSPGARTAVNFLRSSLAPALQGIARAALAIVVAAVVTTIVIALARGNISLAFSALWQGAFGSPYAIGTTLVRATPLLLTGLGVAIAFKARMWNIGGEGQFLVGALLASFLAVNCPVVRSWPSGLLLPAMMLGGCVAGGAWALISGWLKTVRNVPEVISTIMLNFVAIELLSYLVNGPLERPDHSQPATEIISAQATLPIIWRETPLHAGFLLALAAALVVGVFLAATRTGFAIKVVGANADAARVAGIRVERTLLAAMLWSGALCGLAGAVELSGVVGFIPEGYSPGYGYQAIAVALLGRLTPVGIVLSALFFGALSAGSDNMERMAGIDHNVGYVIQAVSLLVLLGAQWVRWEPRVKAESDEPPPPEELPAPLDRPLSQEVVANEP